MDKEVTQILQYISNRHHFLLSGGAGSGKTYTLVQVIRAVLEKYPGKYIACMTYTNSAANEIEHRINDSRLSVSTIHDFLWNGIQNYQNDLKRVIIELSRIPESKIKSKDFDNGFPDNFYDNRDTPVEIKYAQYTKLNDGIISHDEVLEVAHQMFKKYPMLVDVLKSRFQFFFIDEYQDTHREVVEIFLDFFRQTKKEYITGFFGDSMQAIYEDGIGDISKYVHSDGNEYGIVYEVQKKQNRRCPQSVITLANRLRTDGLVQEPSNDPHAPNMDTGGKIKQGTAKFYYSLNNDESRLKGILAGQGWNFNEVNETKELRLTHNLISFEGGFKTLLEIHNQDQIMGYRDRIKDFIKNECIEWDVSTMTFGEVTEKIKSEFPDKKKNWLPTQKQQNYIDKNPQWLEFAMSLNFSDFINCYANKEQLIDDEDDDDEKKSVTGSKLSVLIKYLFKIEECVRLYLEPNYNEFVKKTSFGSIKKFHEKVDLKSAIDKIIGITNNDVTIGEVIDIANQLRICVVDDKLEAYTNKNPYIYKRICAVPYSELKKAYEYYKHLLPFSTQHKTKGLEYRNVLVLLDNGRWSNYNFITLFTDTKSSETVKNRTRKLFYVCCTRTKENLAVFYPNPPDGVVEGAKKMFGEEHVVKIDY